MNQKMTYRAQRKNVCVVVAKNPNLGSVSKILRVFSNADKAQNYIDGCKLPDTEMLDFEKWLVE